ncbi:AcrR family transcriptional regulator [Okibacterium sp. HSC-33S16]|uniref:TetR family transcriptional regulator n=1 Tax=Okibacterium sp. HSC-33S16 TaxID=2910965 RepID=UPI00209E7BD7|nr:TetR family transcriptional regulator [Okibacterium sp. HSC-33S16]MCP2032894.1 AcrR family transcriptional regulator [Okibacterium sp. HSC-33S16]
MTTGSLRTKEVILAAARAEFAAHGMAGGRVDRIAKAAGANVQRIYAYYGDKQGLFDTVVRGAAQSLSTAIGGRQPNIEAFAGAAFDYVVQNPGNTRIMTWARLERENEFFEMIEIGLEEMTPIQAIADLQSLGLVTSAWDAATLLEAIIALSERWHSNSPTYGGGEVAQHRELVLTFARTLVTEPATS